MKFLKNFNEYITESILSKKREEIKNKISKIEADLLNHVDKKDTTVDTKINVPVETIDTEQLELKLESLKTELKNLK